MLTDFLLEIQDFPETVKQLRRRAWDRFLEVGLPQAVRSFNQGQKTLLSKEKLKILPECLASHIVFVNGWYCPELSILPKGCQVMSLTQASKTFTGITQASFTKLLKEEKEGLALLNAAVSQEPAFVYIPPKCIVTAPVQILSVVDCPPNSWAMPRLHLFMGASSEMTLTQCTQVLQGEELFHNAATDIILEDNATLHFSLDDVHNEVRGQFFDTVRLRLMQHATLKSCQLAATGSSFRDWYVQLEGSGAEAHLAGVWLLDGADRVTTNVVVDHRAPHARSLQLFKGVLSGKANSLFQGKIRVAKNALKTEAYQLNNNLMLSDEAVAESRPNLEIFADDVKASHGATTGQLDTEQLFYLKSRGVSEKRAKALLIAGFCREVIENVTIASQKSHFMSLCHERAAV